MSEPSPELVERIAREAAQRSLDRMRRGEMTATRRLVLAFLPGDWDGVNEEQKEEWRAVARDFLDIIKESSDG